jgi:hypothetical protein
MMVLDAGGFEKEHAEDAFEHTLEVIASLTLKWNKMSMAVGFMTNGAMKGGDFTAVPTGRNPKQLSRILEMLARLQMRQKTNLACIMQQGLGSRRGIHYAHFCYQNGRGSGEMRRLCQKNKIPLTVFAWRLNPVSHPDHHLAAADMYIIREIRLQEEIYT